MLRTITESITIAYHYNKARVFEVVLYNDLSLEDLRPPFLIRSPKNCTPASLSLTPAYTRVVFNLVSEVQQCILTFLRMEVETVRAAPVIHYIRCFYCLTVLLDLRALTQNPSSGLNKILDAETLQIEDLLDKWRTLCAQAAGKANCRTPAKFGLILAYVRKWLDREASGTTNEHDGELRLFALLNEKQMLISGDLEGLEEPAAVQSEQEHHHHDKRTNLDNMSEVQLGSTAELTLRGFDQHTTAGQSLEWDQLQQPSAEYDINAGNDWIHQTSFDPFIPMDFDESAIAFFESMSSDVAHSFVPSNIQHTDSGVYEDFMYH